tara:strand:+ start:2231 stop:2416 length:186 start_codon:yes stop_codon:yes gene_type:complete
MNDKDVITRIDDLQLSLVKMQQELTKIKNSICKVHYWERDKDGMFCVFCKKRGIQRVSWKS